MPKSILSCLLISCFSNFFNNSRLLSMTPFFRWFAILFYENSFCFFLSSVEALTQNRQPGKILLIIKTITEE